MQIIELEFTKLGDTTDAGATTQGQIGKLRRQFQSSNINVLLGAGFSIAVVGLLGDYEQKLADAQFDYDFLGGADAYKELVDLQQGFFRTSILPLSDPEKVRKGEVERAIFLSFIMGIVSNRQSAILHKIVNVFTTNYDLLIEAALEKKHIDYVDGFAGKLRPTFSTANYGMILSRQTSISSMTSEVVTVNLYKVHGSLNWRCDNEVVVCQDHVAAIKNVNTMLGTDGFIREYNELAIINPTKEKLNTTVLNANYYDQLRMFCNELEKSNTILLSFGFSFNDEHIRQMTERSLKGNPTLALIIFSFNSAATEQYEKFFESYQNVSVIQLIESSAEDEEEPAVMDCTLARANAVLEEIFNGTK